MVARRVSILGVVLLAVCAGGYLIWGGGNTPAGVPVARAAGAPSPPRHFVGRIMRARRGAASRGTVVGSGALFTPRVFANRQDGFALGNDGGAQYPVRSVDGGRSWRIDGPQFHIDAADGAEGVGFVGVASASTLYAYGSSAVDVSTNAGRTWRETFLGELVVAVVPQSSKTLVAYVQQQRSSNNIDRAVTWQYVTRDGGHHWSYTTTLGALKG